MTDDADDAGAADARGRPSVVVGVFPGQPRRVVMEAARFASHFGAELICAHADPSRFTVAEQADGTEATLSFDPDLAESQQDEFELVLLSELTAVLADTGVPWSVRAVAGDPADALARLAGTLGASMIVVGSRRPGFRGGMQEFIAGSVATHLVHRQHLPVIVIPLSPVAPASALPWE